MIYVKINDTTVEVTDEVSVKKTYNVSGIKAKKEALTKVLSDTEKIIDEMKKLDIKFD